MAAGVVATTNTSAIVGTGTADKTNISKLPVKLGLTIINRTVNGSKVPLLVIFNLDTWMLLDLVVLPSKITLPVLLNIVIGFIGTLKNVSNLSIELFPNNSFSIINSNSFARALELMSIVSNVQTVAKTSKFSIALSRLRLLLRSVSLLPNNTIDCNNIINIF